MNIPGLSTNGILLLHKTIANALREDDRHQAPDKLYGVREFPDWRQEADDLEHELRKRNVDFKPIEW